MVNVVVLASHQMSAAQIQPLELREPFRKLLFQMNQRVL